MILFHFLRDFRACTGVSPCNCTHKQDKYYVGSLRVMIKTKFGSELIVKPTRVTTRAEDFVFIQQKLDLIAIGTRQVASNVKVIVVLLIVKLRLILGFAVDSFHDTRASVAALSHSRCHRPQSRIGLH